MYSVLNRLSEYMYFTYQKTILHELFYVFLKSFLKVFSVSSRQNGINPSNKYSINTEEAKIVPAEFKSPERDGGDNRINTELVNSQTFHNSRMANEQFRQLLQALVNKVITNI